MKSVVQLKSQRSTWMQIMHLKTETLIFKICNVCKKSIGYTVKYETLKLEHVKTFDVQLSQTVWKNTPQFIAWRKTATSPTWSKNWADTCGINSWRVSLLAVYHLILRWKFTRSCQWQSSPRGPRGHVLSCRWPLSAGQSSNAPRWKAKCVHVFVTISSASLFFLFWNQSLRNGADNKMRSRIQKVLMFTFQRNMCKIHQTLHFIS